MIERLLAADAALDRGELDAAQRLFAQVADADPRNAIAAVGMGRVAAARDDAQGARSWFVRALEIDPQEAAARRLLTALDRELAAEATAPAAEDPPAERATEPTTEAAAEPAAPAADATKPAAAPRRSILDRIRAWLRLSGR
jgi:cellulose synthase operon protein C